MWVNIRIESTEDQYRICAASPTTKSREGELLVKTYTGVGMEAIEGLRFHASLPLVLGGPKEARKRNLSIDSISVGLQCLSDIMTISPNDTFLCMFHQFPT